MSVKKTEKAIKGNLNTRSLTNEDEVNNFVTRVTQMEMNFLDTQGVSEAVTKQNINAWLNEMELTFGEGMVQNNVMAGYGGVGISRQTAKLGFNFKNYMEAYGNEIRRLSQVDITEARLLRNAIANNMVSNPDDVIKLYADFDKLVKSSLGQSLEQVKKKFIDKAVFNEVIFFVDSSGRRWTANRYAEMYARTRSREVEDITMTDEMDEVGLDVVLINNVSTTTPICLQFEGKYFSKFGKTPELPRLTILPPFHPNGRHRMLPQANFRTNMLSANTRVNKKVSKLRRGWSKDEKKQVRKQETWNLENRS